MSDVVKPYRRHEIMPHKIVREIDIVYGGLYVNRNQTIVSRISRNDKKRVATGGLLYRLFRVFFSEILFLSSYFICSSLTMCLIANRVLTL